MKISANMNDFNRCAAMVLSNLHESFPQRTNIDVRDLDDEADRNTLGNFMDTMRFLAAEGVIRHGSVTLAGCFIGVQLTAKGLSILNAVPEVIQEKTDYAGALKKALAEGSKEALKTIVGKLFELAIHP